MVAETAETTPVIELKESERAGLRSDRLQVTSSRDRKAYFSSLLGGELQHAKLKLACN